MEFAACLDNPRPTRADITSGIGAIRGQMVQCHEETIRGRAPESVHEGEFGSEQCRDCHGTYKLKIKIAPDGSVARADSNPDDLLGRCLVAEIKQARFAPSCQGMSVTYPFVFR